MTYHIFDLDGTVIDSRHRYRTLPNGDIDLPYWLEQAEKREMVFADTLLPLVHRMRKLFIEGETVIVCTSRTIHPLWIEFLSVHNIPYSVMLARPDGCMTGDADLKEQMLDEYFDSIGKCLDDVRAIMYEDHMGVIERLSRRGVICSIEGYDRYAAT